MHGEWHAANYTDASPCTACARLVMQVAVLSTPLLIAVLHILYVVVSSHRVDIAEIHHFDLGMCNCWFCLVLQVGTGRPDVQYGNNACTGDVRHGHLDDCCSAIHLHSL